MKDSTASPLREGAILIVGCNPMPLSAATLLLALANARLESAKPEPVLTLDFKMIHEPRDSFEYFPEPKSKFIPSKENQPWKRRRN